MGFCVYDRIGMKLGILVKPARRSISTKFHDDRYNRRAVGLKRVSKMADFQVFTCFKALGTWDQENWKASKARQFAMLIQPT